MLSAEVGTDSLKVWANAHARPGTQCWAGSLAMKKSAVSMTFEACHCNSLERQNTSAFYKHSKATRVYFLNKLDQTAKVNLLIIV